MMKMDRYFIGCRWDARKEDLSSCTNRIVRCLKGLATCDEEFSEIYIVPRSRKLPYRISDDFETLKPLVKQGRNREDVPPRKIIERLGYSISFVSGPRQREDRWKIGILCGAYPEEPPLPNHCNLALPEKREKLSELLLPAKAISLVQVLIDAWDPDWAVVQNHGFHNQVGEWLGSSKSSKNGVLMGWMTYVSKQIGNVPQDLPVHSRIELERGTLLTLTEDPITLDHPEHVAKAQEVLAGLRGIG